MRQRLQRSSSKQWWYLHVSAVGLFHAIGTAPDFAVPTHLLAPWLAGLRASTRVLALGAQARVDFTFIAARAAVGHARRAHAQIGLAPKTLDETALSRRHALAAPHDRAVLALGSRAGGAAVPFARLAHATVLVGRAAGAARAPFGAGDGVYVADGSGSGGGFGCGRRGAVYERGHVAVVVGESMSGLSSSGDVPESFGARFGASRAAVSVGVVPVSVERSSNPYCTGMACG